MKKLILVLSLLSIMAQARALDTAAKARRVKAQIQNSVMSVPGVNGIGITGCNPATGLFDLGHDFVHCIQITTETKAAMKSLQRTYPPGVKFRGVFVTVKYIGTITPQPRMSGGR